MCHVHVHPPAEYIAPEVIRAGEKPGEGAAPNVYGPPCDLWSCGVILFMLLGGYPPFWHDSHPCLLRAISSGKFGFDDPVWRDVSGEAKDLICKLLMVDPAKRPTPEQVRGHVGWFCRCLRHSSMQTRRRDAAGQQQLVLWLPQVLAHPWAMIDGKGWQPLEDWPLLLPPGCSTSSAQEHGKRGVGLELSAGLLLLVALGVALYFIVFG